MSFVQGWVALCWHGRILELFNVAIVLDLIILDAVQAFVAILADISQESPPNHINLTLNKYFTECFFFFFFCDSVWRNPFVFVQAKEFEEQNRIKKE